MTRRKRKSGLPEEVLAVLRILPNPQPGPRFRNSDIEQFAQQVNGGKRELCLTVSGQRDKELRL
jgi:hypothetical protein